MKVAKPVVIITGVSQGIGLATAKLFSAKGWLVVGSFRGSKRPPSLEGLAADLQPAEMESAADLARLVEGAASTYGRIDALVCNAGYGLLGELAAMSYPEMARQLAVNTLAPMELARLVLPTMQRQRQGAIIMIGSVAGRIGLPGYSVYGASKFALEGFAQGLSYELQPVGIRVAVVEPSVVRTAFWEAAGVSRSPRLGLLGGRELTAEQVAERVYLVASGRSRRWHYPLGWTLLATAAQRLLPEGLLRAGVRRAWRGEVR